MMAHHVYIIQSEQDGSYYIGSTQDLVERLNRHNQGRSPYTKPKRPWQIVYTEGFPNKSDALKSENEIKKRKSKNYIES